MLTLKKISLFILLFISLFTYSQNKENSFYAEIVIIENIDLIETINSIINENNCINKNADLYLDYRKDKHIILGQSNIKKYIKSFKIDNVKVYMTFIDNNPFFIFSNSNSILQIKKTDYKVDLTEFLDYNNYSINDLSNWILEDKDGEIKVVKKVLRGCKEI